MPACALFGHHDCPLTIKPILQNAILAMIEQSTDTFYVGNQGAFDRLAQHVLHEIKEQFPAISCFIVLAYIPGTTKNCFPLPTILPDGMESVPPMYAIQRRNQWLLEQADAFIFYQEHSWGNTAKLCEQAKRKGKQIIQIP